jgi:hypothetical protein
VDRLGGGPGALHGPGEQDPRDLDLSGGRVQPGEDWFWDYRTEKGMLGPELAAPTAHPEDQTTPGPAERVPADWQQHIH